VKKKRCLSLFVSLFDLGGKRNLNRSLLEQVSKKALSSSVSKGQNPKTDKNGTYWTKKPISFTKLLRALFGNNTKGRHLWIGFGYRVNLGSRKKKIVDEKGEGGKTFKVSGGGERVTMKIRFRNGSLTEDNYIVRKDGDEYVRAAPAGDSRGVVWLGKTKKAKLTIVGNGEIKWRVRIYARRPRRLWLPIPVFRTN